MDIKYRGSAQIFTRLEIEHLIAAGNALVILDGHVLRLDAWQDLHPGGRMVIQHMVGRDATDEISISHSPHVIDTMKRYRIGRIHDKRWLNFVPPIQGGVFRTEQARGPEANVQKASSLSSASSLELSSDSNDFTAQAVRAEIRRDVAKYPSLDPTTQGDIAHRFRALHQRVRDEGYYDTRYSEYGKELVRYSLLFGLFLWCLHRGWHFPSACALGLWWHQIMFTAHDAGHCGITHNFVIDSLIGIFIGNFCSGLSIGWWRRSHDLHHIVTNDPVHDPDIQNVPIFATSPACFTSIKSSYYDGFCFVWDGVAEWAVPYQKYTYYPIMAVARFNLYILSWGHLLSRRSSRRGPAAWTTKVEMVGVVFYFYVFFYLLLWRSIPTWSDRAVFLLVSHLVTMPLHVQITLSHWSTSTSDLGPAESFAQRQLRTTMDISCPAWLDFIHGGLQFQAVHHLFPRVPRHNLRALQALVKDFCADTGIEHLCLGFRDGNRDVLGKLAQVAEQARMLAACQKHMAETGVSGLH